MRRACVLGIQKGISGTTSIKQFRMLRLHERDGDIVVLLWLFLPLYNLFKSPPCLVVS